MSPSEIEGAELLKGIKIHERQKDCHTSSRNRQNSFHTISLKLTTLAARQRHSG